MGRTDLLWMEQPQGLLFLANVKSQRIDDITTQGTGQTGLSDSTLRMTIPARLGLIPVLLCVSLIIIIFYQPLPFSLNPDETCNNKFNLNAQLS